MAIHLFLYAVSFFFIWYGSGLIVTATTKFSKKLRISPFLFSFLFLGLLTSIPEFSVGLQAIASDHSEIFVGNLLGGVIILFLVVIPLLAIIGNGVSMKNGLKGFSLLFTLLVILAPAFTVLDKVVTNFEGVMMIGMYVILMIFIQKDNGLLAKDNKKVMNEKKYSYKDVGSLLLGLAIVFLSSNILLEKTLYFAELLNISAFYISLIVVAFGTDTPEFILAIRASMQKKRDVAMGDYIGAAAASTLLFGIFTLLTNGEVVTVDSFWITFTFIAIALTLFFFFSRSKQHLSRKEGVILFCVYLAFLFFEIKLR